MFRPARAHTGPIGVLTSLSGRKITILLWANAVVAVTPWVLEHTVLGHFDSAGTRGELLEYATVWTLLFVVVQLAGPLEQGWPRSVRSLRPIRRFGVSADTGPTVVVHRNSVVDAEPDALGTHVPAPRDGVNG